MEEKAGGMEEEERALESEKGIEREREHGCIR